MAARQDQTLVIALIVFVCISVIGLAWGYLMFKSSSDAHQQITSLRSQLQDKEGAANKLQVENESYRQYLGVGQFDNFEDVEEIRDEDMQRYGGTFDETQRNYRNILEALYTENTRAAQQVSEGKEQIRQLNERLLAVEQEKEQQVQQFKGEMEKAQADLARQRREFDQDRAELEATKQELLQSKASQKEFYDKKLAESEGLATDLKDKLDKNERALAKLIEERATQTIGFEVADGRVSWVNQDGTVWINRGSADALRPQITFSIYDADLPDPATAEKKGSIEVTRILGNHMAEARITDDVPTNPILSGDRIYSQVWHRGKQLRFALTGLIDFDDDGQSDVQKAMDLIKLNGGVVDAYLSDEGAVEGEMTVNTRYLVLGEHPMDPLKAAHRDGWNAMSEEANTLGVEPILLSEFLNQMGYTSEERTVPLGASSRSSDFSAGSEAGSNPLDSASRFRSRTPYRTRTTTPY